MRWRSRRPSCRPFGRSREIPRSIAYRRGQRHRCRHRTSWSMHAGSRPRPRARQRDPVGRFHRLAVRVRPMARAAGARRAADAHCRAGRPLRVITTVYTGSTERKALDWLVALGAQVKVCYDTQSTRLHAKAWLFRRASGYSTAYIGSSNLSKSALVDGVEWNVRLSQVGSPDILEKFDATFEATGRVPNTNPMNRPGMPRRFDRAVAPEQGDLLEAPLAVPGCRRRGPTSARCSRSSHAGARTASPLQESCRGRDGNRQDHRRRARLQAPARSARATSVCCLWPIDKKS